jgi:glycosyltransferase involved in cell wall biosynthesis
MRVSGFSFVRNALDLYYPLEESIRSLLPLCDQVVVAAGDSSDGTTELLRGIGEPKLHIVETVWDPGKFVRGASNAEQTNIALARCDGDWALYLQADEVLHEDDLPVLRRQMETYLDDPRVDGFVFEYLHFFADYDHVQSGHSWYRREVRLIRNHRGIRSWKSAQGFRRDGRKIRVVAAGARIFHYGWVRPPRLMSRKSRALGTVHIGAAAAAAKFPDRDFDYGQLHGRRLFRGAHPAVMGARIAARDWQVEATRTRRKHDQLGQRLLSWLENRVLGFRLAEHRNYILLPP